MGEGCLCLRVKSRGHEGVFVGTATETSHARVLYMPFTIRRGPYNVARS